LIFLVGHGEMQDYNCKIFIIKKTELLLGFFIDLYSNYSLPTATLESDFQVVIEAIVLSS